MRNECPEGKPGVWRAWRARAAGTALALVIAGDVTNADTLVMRNGTRLSGRLVGVRDGVIEFDEDRGNGSRRVRLDQQEVRSIEFEREFGGRPDDIGSGTGRPRGLREREVSVSARTPWTNTGISVRAGSTIYFSASGRVRWGSNRQDGPGGESGSPRNANRPIPSRPAAALIGRIGDDTPFLIGTDESGIRARSSGTLELGINDDTFDDNSGAFTVRVFY